MGKIYGPLNRFKSNSTKYKVFPWSMGMYFVLKFATTDPMEAKWLHLEVSSEIFLNRRRAPQARARRRTQLQAARGHLRQRSSLSQGPPKNLRQSQKYFRRNLKMLPFCFYCVECSKFEYKIHSYRPGKHFVFCGI